METKRNVWGALVAAEGLACAQELSLDAQIAGKIEGAYCDVDRKHRGSALSYDIYDIYGDDLILVQQRHTTCTKYGNSPQKNYLLLLRNGPDIAVVEAPHKMAIARAAKLGLPLGKIVEKITGCKTQDEITAKFFVAPRMAAKEVAA